ncbi:unnamed protein product [marine sediment metagenome]|uniref:DNA polymerase beta thumb domain-containing protein n=1 Tax=marine sediment metagenome TaxID=412755 RepID=X1HQS8_9ZZZZ
MNLIRAEAKAKYLIKEFGPFTDQIEIVGNIRRRKQAIEKIVILLAPKGALLFKLMAKFSEWGCEDGMRAASKKVILLKDELEEIRAEFYFTTPEKWPIMLFLKTGGNKSIQRIATLCSNKKWELSVSDATIFDENGKKLLIEKEEDISKLLGIPYITPDWRE